MKEISAAIHQPNFLPWLGYFHKMSIVDVFVLFDDVQVPTGKSFANRVLIKTNTGEFWLTVPTQHKSEKNDFNSVGILSSNWRTKSLKTIRLAYQKAAHFNTHFDRFEHTFMKPAETLFDFNYDLLIFLRDALGIKTKLVRSSQLSIDPELNGTGKILAILEAVSAATYVSGKGSGSRRYIDESEFGRRHIKLVWQEFTSTPYPQLHGEFIPNLSALDYLLNCGPMIIEPKVQ